MGTMSKKPVITEMLCRALLGVADALAQRAADPKLGDVEGAFKVLLGEEPDRAMRAAYRIDQRAVDGKSPRELRVLALDYLVLAHNSKVRLETDKRPDRETKVGRCVLWVWSGAPFSEVKEAVEEELGEAFGGGHLYVVSPHVIDGMARIDLVGAYAEEVFHLLDDQFSVWWANEDDEQAWVAGQGQVSKEPKRCSCERGCAACRMTGIVPALTGEGP